METGPQFKVSSDKLEKLGIEPATPGLQNEWSIHYTTETPFLQRNYIPYPVNNFVLKM